MRGSRSAQHTRARYPGGGEVENEASEISRVRGGRRGGARAGRERLRRCGGGGGNSTSTTTASQGKTFPELKVVWGTTDYMDPGLSYRLESWQIFQDVYLGLVAKRYVTCGVGAGCTKIIPALAESLPTVEQRRHRPQVHAPQGAEVLGRRAGQGERLQEHDHPRLQAELAGNRVLLQHRRQRRLRGESDEVLGHLGDHRRRQGRHGRDQAEQASVGLPVHPHDVLRGDRPVHHAGEGHRESAAPAAGPYYISSYKPSRSFVVQRNPHYKPIPGIPTGNPDKIVAIMTNDLAQSAQYIAVGPVRLRREHAPDRPAEASSSRSTATRSSSGGRRRRTTSS